MPQDDVPFQPVWGTVCYGHDSSRPDTWHHWNTDIPGAWHHSVRPDQAGSNVANYITSNCGGVYRLVGLAGRFGNSPAQLNRVCGIDETGTALYWPRQRPTCVRIQCVRGTQFDFRQQGCSANYDHHQATQSAPSRSRASSLNCTSYPIVAASAGSCGTNA